MRILPRLTQGFFAIGIGFLLAACGGLNDASEVKAKKAPVCGLTPTCDAAPLRGEVQGFAKKKPKGEPWHHGKDLYLNEFEQQWVIGTFQYGNYLLRSPLSGEAVEVQLLRTCGGEWETLGVTTTTSKSQHPSVLGYDDEGGMIFFPIPEDKRLEIGRHRLRLVVRGDQSATEMFIEILAQNTSLFVSDVDGTLTKGEYIQGLAAVFGTLPPAHPGASTLLRGLAKKGYRPVYLTARSSNLTQRSRDFVASKKFPPGIIQTSTAKTFGISGAKGVAYKTAALQSLEDRGFRIAYAFGNSKVDAEAFANADIPDSQKFFFNYDDYGAFGGGSDFDDYRTLAEVLKAENLCVGS